VASALIVLAGLGLAAGCGGDVSSMLSGNAAVRDKVMTAIAANSTMAGAMTDRLLGTDSTQAIVLDRLFANGGAVQAMLVRVARNATMVDGVVNLAVQDTAMKTHVLTLVRGMEMGTAAAK
jgi:hypothetical protein